MSDPRKLWLTSLDDENWTWADRFETRDEAIANPPESCEPGQTYYVAKMVAYRPGVNADAVIDNVVETAWDFGGEHTEGWLSKIPATELSDLETRLTAVLQAWLKETGNEPTFFQVDCISSHYVEPKAKSIPEAIEAARGGSAPVKLTGF